MAEKPKAEEKTPTLADLRQLTDLYHVPYSDGTLADIAKDLTPEKFTAFEGAVKMQAEGLYPTLAPQIRAGIPTAYLLDPYRQVAKQKLGDQYEPDFQTNPADTAALTGGQDPKTGSPAPMSLDQWKQHIQTDPQFGYDKTPQAIAQAQSTIQGLHEGLNRGPNDA